jgi:hypothetical protein
MRVMNWCLIILFLTMAMFAFYFHNELLSSLLGNALLVSFGLFWLARFILQFVFFSMKHVLSKVLSLVFLVLSLGFILPVLL